MPQIPARVEKRYKFLGERINTSEVGPLPQVATMTSERQVVEFLGAAVLLGNDVFDVMS
jgi:hypothetical protein